jgi:mannose-1-phosphate guanylyltransferase
MNCMILAAGRGSRLGRLGQEVPKVLVEVGGEPVLARQLRYLKACGARRIVINSHHLSDQLRRFIAEHPLSEEIELLFEPKLLGTAGGVRNALGLLGEEPFAVLYGDVLIDEPIDAVLAAHRATNASATLTVYRSRQLHGKGTVKLATDGRIASFAEKAVAPGETEAYVNAGLYVISPELVSRLPPGVEADFGHDVFPAALAGGVRLFGHVLRDPIIDMGTPETLAQARARHAAPFSP